MPSSGPLRNSWHRHRLHSTVASTALAMTAEVSTNGLTDSGATLAEGQGGARLSTQAQRSIRSWESEMAAHRQKLEAYKANPDAFDNKGFLKNAPSLEIRERLSILELIILNTRSEMFRSKLMERDKDAINNGCKTTELRADRVAPYHGRPRSCDGAGRGVTIEQKEFRSKKITIGSCPESRPIIHTRRPRGSHWGNSPTIGRRCSAWPREPESHWVTC
jgi:hypothetical protein